MFTYIKRKLKERKAFTLLEMIVVIGVIGILLTIATVGITGYMTSAYMIRVNQTAKTVYMAAQNYITREKSLGNLEEINEQFPDENVLTKDQIKEILERNYQPADNGGASFSQFYKEYEEKYDNSNIRYLYLDSRKEDGSNETKRQKNLIWQILSKSIKDEDIAENTFLMEYDTATGVVRSVFYTEKIDSFINGYERTNTDSRDNVILRDSTNLTKKRQGYFGVDASNLISDSISLNKPEVRLVNDEKLYLEWKDTNFVETGDEEGSKNIIPNLAFLEDNTLKDSLCYDIKIYAGNELKLEMKDVGKTNLPVSLNEAESRMTDGNILAYDTETYTYQLQLDCLHHSIEELYPDAGILPTDYLHAEITVKLDGHASTTETAVSNVESAQFGGGAKETTWFEETVSVGGSGNSKENGEEEDEYSLMNARHLDNMRNVASDSWFVQRADINWGTVEGEKNTLFFEPLEFADSKIVYKGSFQTDETSSKRLQIKGIRIQDKTSMYVGMFCQIGTEGSIRGITLADAEVTGVSYVGALAGQNAGTLEDIQVDADVSGVIPKSGTKSEVVPGQYIGGVAGRNIGTAKEIVTAVLENGKAKSAQKTVSGTTSVGGVFGINESADVSELINYNGVQIIENTENVNDQTFTGYVNFGGVVGENGENAKLISCENRGKLLLQTLKIFTDNKVKMPENIGGIAGKNTGTIEDCKNILESQSDLYTKTVSEYFKTLEEKQSLPTYIGKYVGGITGLNATDKAKVKNCSVDNLVTGYEIVGGIAGRNEGTVESGSVARTGVKGVVAGTTSMVGGIFGIDVTGTGVSEMDNYAYVFGAEGVGGIVGINGAIEEYKASVFTGLQAGSESYYQMLQTAGYGADAVNTGSEIKNCGNYGFVYAAKRYSGGITGINFGSVTNCQSNSQIEQTNVMVANYKSIANADCVGGVIGLAANESSVEWNSAADCVNVIYGNDFVGGTIGLNQSSMAISRKVTVQGAVYGKGNYVGGFVGMNMGEGSYASEIECRNQEVTGTYFVGGVYGAVISSGENGIKLTNQQVTGGEIKGNAYLGGIVGYSSYLSSKNEFPSLCVTMNQEVSNVYASYDETASSVETKPAVNTVIENCKNYANVSGYRYIGGLIGYNSGNSALQVKDGWNYGTAEALTAGNPTAEDKTKGKSYFVGGITGRNSWFGIIENCFNRGDVISKSKYLGGICEVNEGIIRNCILGDEENYTTKISSSEGSVGGIVGLNQTVSNLQTATVENCKANKLAAIEGADNTGGMVGTNAGTVEECTTYANVKGGNNVGGLVGINKESGSMKENYVLKGSAVQGKNNVGGFIGNNMGYLTAEGESTGSGSTISNLENNANVSGTHNVGGIVGAHQSSLITNCTNNGNITATGSGTGGYAGGITGENKKDVTISECVNTGTITSNSSQAGGISGSNSGKILSCTNRGSVKGATAANQNDAIGGIAGRNLGTVETCKSIKNGNNSIMGGYNVGGLVGDNRGTIIADQDPVDISIIVVSVSSSGSLCKIGGIVGNNTQMELKDFTYSGTISVQSSQKQAIGGITAATDILNKQKQTVSSCVFAGSITGVGNKDENGGVGGIVGVNKGSIANSCQSTVDGVIQGNVNVGGIVGIDEGSTIGSDSDVHVLTNKAAITGNQYVGGIAGKSKNVIYKNAVNTGTITARTNVSGSNVGGITGSMTGGGLSDCTNSGLIQEEGDGKNATVVNMGGLIGNIVNSSAWTTVLDNCHNTGDIQYGNSYIGGLIGKNLSALDIKKSSNTGNILQTKAIQEKGYIGGLIGYTEQSVVTITNSNNGVKNGTSSIQVGAGSTGGILGFVTGSRSILNMEFVHNYADITGAGSLNYLGGLVGYSFRGTDKEPCIMIMKNSGNEGDITANKNEYVFGTNIGYGGLVGGAGIQVDMESCTNTGNVDGGKSSRVGGLIGILKPQTEHASDKPYQILECTNSGTVTGDEAIGGLIGWIENQQSELVISNSNNSGNIIVGLKAGGGLIGKLHGGADGGTVKECTNNGMVIGTPIDSKQTNISNLGGGLGAAESSAKLVMESVSNMGDIEIQWKKDNAGFTKASNIGGIAGYLLGKDIILSKCENQGTLKIETADKTKPTIDSLGGIAGTINANVLIVNCLNNMDILTGDANVDGSKLGGIVGSGTAHPTTQAIYNCENYGSVSGGNGNRIGGIAGEFSASIISGKNINQGQKKIEGNLQIGGLVGNGSQTCKIYSLYKGLTVDEVKAYIANQEQEIPDVEKEITLELGYNEMDVYGNSNTGGIMGQQVGATIMSVYNSGAVIATGTPTKLNESIGGIVGYSTSIDKYAENPNNNGVIINCYNVGYVGYPADVELPDLDKTPNATWGCVGGIVGMRDPLKKEVDGVTYYKSTSIKDSYFDEQQVQQSRTNTMIKDENDNNHTVQPNSWAVGNEPYAIDYTPVKNIHDTQISEDVQGVWTKKAFNDIVKKFGLSLSWKNTADLKAITAIMQKYTYVLEAPGTLEVMADAGYLYTMKYQWQQGLTSGVEVKLYEGSVTEENLADASPIAEYHLKGNESSGTVELALSEEILQAHAGQELVVTIKALGFRDKNGKVYTLDSKETIAQRFVPMPPLPKVQASAVEKQQKVARIYLDDFMARYGQTAYEKYATLQNADRDIWYTQDIYEAFLKGLWKITVVDYSKSTLAGADEEKYANTFYYDSSNILRDGDGREYIEIDYLKTGNTFSGRNYHKVYLQAQISDEMSLLSVDLRKETFRYRYLSSETESVEYEVPTVGIISTPEELKAVYQGEETTKLGDYKLTWKQPGTDKKDVDFGYTITVRSDVTGKEISVSTGKGVREYVLTAQQMNQLTEGRADVESLSFTVKAKGDGGKTYTDSLTSNGQTLKVPQKIAGIQNLTAVLDEDSDSTVRFTWEDAQAGVNESYLVDTTVLPDAEGVTTSDGLTSERTSEVTVPELISKNYEITLKVSKKGVTGVSLDSEPVEITYTVYQRLDTVTNVSRDPGYTALDKENITYRISWTPPKQATAENCDGYRIEIVDADNIQGTDAQEVLVDGFGTGEAEVTFNTNQLGSRYFIYVYARGRAGVRSDSRQSVSEVFDLPVRMPTPEIVSGKILLQGKEWTEAVCSEEEFAKLTYQFAVTPVANTEYDCEAAIYDEETGNEEKLEMEVTCDAATGILEVSGIPGEYQGKILSITIRARNSALVNQYLPSEPLTMQLAIPQIQEEEEPTS